MNKCFFHSPVQSHFPGRRRLIDQSGTQVKKTTLRVIDNDFAPGLSCLSFWVGKEGISRWSPTSSFSPLKRSCKN